MQRARAAIASAGARRNVGPRLRDARMAPSSLCRRSWAEIAGCRNQLLAVALAAGEPTGRAGLFGSIGAGGRGNLWDTARRGGRPAEEHLAGRSASTAEAQCNRKPSKTAGGAGSFFTCSSVEASRPDRLHRRWQEVGAWCRERVVLSGLPSMAPELLAIAITSCYDGS